MKLRLFWAALVAAIAPLIPTLALADQGRIFKTAGGDVVVYGLSAKQTLTVGTQWANRRVNPADVCGQVVVKPNKQWPLATIRVNGTDINPVNLTVQTLAKCDEATRTLTPPRTGHYKTSRNWIVLVGMPYVQHTIYYPDRLIARKATANACGFAQFKDLPRQPFAPVLRLPTTSGTTARFTLADIPLFLPILCRKGGLLVPPGWAPPLAQAIANSSDASVEVGFTPTGISSGGSSSGGSSGSTTGGSGSSGSGSSSGGSSGNVIVTVGIRVSLADHPGWTGVVVSDTGYNSDNKPIQAAKTSDNQIVLANFPGSGTNSYGPYDTTVGESEGEGMSGPVSSNGCGYVVIGSYDKGAVVYRLRNDEYNPIARFYPEDLPTLDDAMLQDLAAGCKL